MAARNVDQQLTEVASMRMERNVLLQRAFLLEYARWEVFLLAPRQLTRPLPRACRRPGETHATE
jgi:hypothetical protein